MIYAGSPIAPERLREALDVFGPIFVQTYAGTEPGYVSCLRKEDHRVDTDTRPPPPGLGRPTDPLRRGHRSRTTTTSTLPVGEVGEICSRQLGQMLGYVDTSRNAEALRDGWVHTGDIGRLDDDGFLYIVDRKKDMVVSGGFNVFPRQVEDVLLGHPAVRAGRGDRHPARRSGARRSTPSSSSSPAPRSTDRGAHRPREGRARRASPRPRPSTSSTELPVNPAGKVDKKTLRAPFWAGP